MLIVSCNPPPNLEVQAEEQRLRDIRDKERDKEWKRGSLEFKVARLIADSDSIGEGYSHCRDYNPKMHKEKGNEYRDLAKTIIRLVRK